jgi:hypothetical protein
MLLCRERGTHRSQQNYGCCTRCALHFNLLLLRLERKFVKREAMAQTTREPENVPCSAVSK